MGRAATVCTPAENGLVSGRVILHWQSTIACKLLYGARWRSVRYLCLPATIQTGKPQRNQLPERPAFSFLYEFRDLWKGTAWVNLKHWTGPKLCWQKKKHAKNVFLQFVWNSTWTSQGETWALASRRAMFTDTPVSESSCTRSRSMFRTLWTSEANSPPQVQQASVERCAIKIRPRDRGQCWPAVSSSIKPTVACTCVYIYIYIYTHLLRNLRTWCCKFWVPVQIHDMKTNQV